MKLNQNIDISLPVNDTTKKYRVLRSEDGINWIDITSSDLTPVNGKINFKTNHFTFFAVVEAGNNPITPEPPIVTPPPVATCNSLAVNPAIGVAPLSSSFTCNAT